MKHIWTLLMLMLLVTPLAFAELDDTAPMEIRPAAELDENLFLMRALEVTYDRWPRDMVDRNQLQIWLGQTRSQISLLSATIKDRKLDPSIGKLYDDCLQLLSVYEGYMENLGVIDRNAAKQAQEDSVDVLQSSVNIGSEATKLADRAGATTNDSLGIGLAAGVLGAIFDGYQRSQARDEAQRSALEAERRKVNATWTDAQSSAAVVAERLTKQYGWKLGEAGFDGYASHEPRNYLTELKRRPRDPFAIVVVANFRQANETADAIIEDVRALFYAASLVPEGQAYNSFRTEIVRTAADLSVTAAVSQLPKSTYSLGPSPWAPAAVRICNTLLALDPEDAFGTGNSQLARALAASNRYEEALTAASVALKKEKWRNDAGFSIRTAKLLSLTNRLDGVDDWLKLAYQMGFNQVSVVRDSADFANYRKGKPEQYKQLTTVRSSFRIVFGVISDDVVIENNSPFTLTNIRLAMVVRQNDRTWRPDLVLSSLAPGESHTFSDAFSIPNDTYDEARATLVSDQGTD